MIAPAFPSAPLPSRKREAHELLGALAAHDRLALETAALREAKGRAAASFEVIEPLHYVAGVANETHCEKPLRVLGERIRWTPIPDAVDCKGCLARLVAPLGGA